MANKIKLALLGFGNVGQAFIKLLRQKQGILHTHYKIDSQVVGIATRSHGSAIDPKGLDLEQALIIAQAEGDLSSLSKIADIPDSTTFIQKCGADVLMENTPVNYQNGQPAVDHLRKALLLGMHAITANKGPLVHAFRELGEVARSQNKKFFFESTVLDGAPIFSMWRETLPGAELVSFRGVLNSTTNFILTQMEEGISFEKALAEAQAIGVAETDPSGDIDGWDAAVKVAALVNVLMDTPLLPEDVNREGIGSITKEQVLKSAALGKRWKLICEAQKATGGVSARVSPQEIDASNPLYSVMGTSSSVSFISDVLGPLTIQNDDPGPTTTAYGLLADFVNAVRSTRDD